jgi:(4S)-4-hydroxy-5-phosphonooxypentane-2,3-dione isomerase
MLMRRLLWEQILPTAELDRFLNCANSPQGYHQPGAMLIVHVKVKVKPEFVDAFVKATVENARNSIREPGVARFDVVQQQHDRSRFVLVEAYRTDDAPAKHKETAHYQAWRDAVAPMMAEPRSSVKFVNLFPEDREW